MSNEVKGPVWFFAAVGLLLMILAFVTGGRINNYFADKQAITNATHNHISYYYDSIEHVPGPSTSIVLTNTVHDTIPVNVDCDTVKKDYFTTNDYAQSFQDTKIRIDARASVARNQLQKLDLSYKLLQPTTIVQPTVESKPRRNYYIGGFASVALDTTRKLLGAGASVMYQDRKQNCYEARYDIINKAIGGTYYFNLRSHQRK